MQPGSIKRQLAERLGRQPPQPTRRFDCRHASRLDHTEAALHALGRRRMARARLVEEKLKRIGTAQPKGLPKTTANPFPVAFDKDRARPSRTTLYISLIPDGVFGQEYMISSIRPARTCPFNRFRIERFRKPPGPYRSVNL